MVDCVNNLTKHYEEMWSYAKQKGFEVSNSIRIIILKMINDPNFYTVSVCAIFLFFFPNF